jgi:GH15 family glucan-1,4-alpha-glucosidase
MTNLDYGIIGNCQSAALISRHGDIEWCCLPQFDSASVFARILDEEKGGSFDILVDDSYKTNQKYIPNTTILVTEFDNGTDGLSS